MTSSAPSAHWAPWAPTAWARTLLPRPATARSSVAPRLLSSLGARWRETLDATWRSAGPSVEAWTGLVDPAWSLTEVRARVLRVIVETPETRTFVLGTNRRWPGHLPGQHTTLEVEIDGVRHRRCYSIASGSSGTLASPLSWHTAAPGPTELSLTVKRAAGGRVSGWLHDHLREGDLVRLGRPAGAFLLPTEAAEAGRTILISAGSGITPLMAMLRSLVAIDRVDDVWFIHHARSRRELIFGAELERLAREQPGLHLWLALGDEPASGGRFDEAQLARRVPDFAERPARLCGPASFMDRVDAQWRAAGAAHRLLRERFQPPAWSPPTAANDTSVTGDAPAGPAPDWFAAHLERGGATVAISGGEVLLPQLERAGAEPASGCRMGICHTCQCRKRSGVVRNVLTGALSREPDEDIQLCVSVACSDLVLDAGAALGAAPTPRPSSPASKGGR